MQQMQSILNPRQPGKDGIARVDIIGESGPPDSGVLPDFCRGEMVLNIVMLAEFLAIIFTILVPPLTANLFLDLFMISLFLQWIALLSVSALCLARPFLNRLPDNRALLFTYAMLLCITWLVGELSVWLLATFDFLSTPRSEWQLNFHVQNLVVSAIINAMALRYFVARDQLRKTTLATERARAQILKHRIRPHFLFNSMNIIASLTQSAPAKAEAALEDMADLFRLMLDDRKDLAPVQDEIKVARKYLKLEKLRLEKRLNVNWSVNGVTRQAKTPVLMLQLLLENAVRHGIEPLPEGGYIDIDIGIVDEDLRVLVRNSVLPKKTDRYQEGEVALDNVRLRLRDLYGDDASVDIRQGEQSFTVEIRHPAFGGITK